MLNEVQNTKEFSAQRLVKVFDQLFYTSFNTRLIGGADEPLYVPANCHSQPREFKNAKSGACAKVIFRMDYFASALHEVAHWCVAGEERRKLEDYGYWYAPDGRTEEQQALFERVEIKPQAMEWIFSRACGYKFRVSADNLVSELGPSLAFKQNICEQAKNYCDALPKRAKQFAEGLAREFKQENVFNPTSYKVEMLQ